MTEEESREIWKTRETKTYLCARGIRGRVTNIRYSKQFGEYYAYGYRINDPVYAWQAIQPKEYTG